MFFGESESGAFRDSFGVRLERQTHLRGTSRPSPSSPGGVTIVDVEPGGEDGEMESSLR